MGEDTIMQGTISTPGPRPGRQRRFARGLGGIGILLVVAGGSLAVGNGLWYSTRTWNPVHQPIPLAIGHVETSEFVVNLEENFVVKLALDRSLPSDLMVNVLGIGDPLSHNDSEQPGFKMAWTVESGGKTVKSGVSDGRGQGYWGSAGGRTLGFFRAQKNTPYKIKIDVREEGSKLTPYHPRLLVEVDMGTLEGYFIATGIMQLTGVAIGAIGVLLVIISVILRWRSRKQVLG